MPGYCIRTRSKSVVCESELAAHASIIIGTASIPQGVHQPERGLNRQRSRISIRWGMRVDVGISYIISERIATLGVIH